MSGQVRKSNNLRIKIEETVRLGFKNVVVPKLEEALDNNFKNLINIKEISNIREAVDYSFRVILTASLMFEISFMFISDLKLSFKSL